MSDYNAIDARLITEDDYDAEISRLRAALEVAERDRESWRRNWIAMRAERDALKERADAAERLVEIWKSVEKSKHDAADALKEQVEAARDKLMNIAAREWRDEGGRIAAAVARDGLTALACLDQRETE